MIKNYYCILWSFLTSFVCHNETKNSLRSLMNVKTHLPMPQHWAIFGYYRRCTTHFDAYTTIKIRHSNSLIYLYYIIPFEDIHSKYFYTECSRWIHTRYKYKVQIQSTRWIQKCLQLLWCLFFMHQHDVDIKYSLYKMGLTLTVESCHFYTYSNGGRNYLSLIEYVLS